MDRFQIDGNKIKHHPEQILQWLKDPKKLYPLYVEISPSGTCNQRCSFCALDYVGYIPRIIETRVIKDCIGQMSHHGVKSVMFAGEGEPLLHKHLSEIINFTRMSNIDVAVTTNGTLMSEGFVTNCLDSITWIKVSINAGTKEVYQQIHNSKEGDWEKVWKNITFATSYRNVQGLRTAIGIQCVVLPENVHTLDELMLEAKLSGVDYVVIKPYSQHLLSTETATKYSGLTYDTKEVFEKIAQKYSDETFEVVVRENAMGQTRNYDQCHSVPNFWAYVMSDGSVYACSAYLLDERFKLGNINESPFEQIWESPKRQEITQMMEQLDIKECRLNCRMNQVNKYLYEIKNPPPHASFI